jgi:hypothetical protein
MKKILTLGILSLFSIAMFTSCEDGGVTISVDKEQAIVNFVLTSGTNGTWSKTDTQEALNIDQFLLDQGYKREDLKSVYLKSGKLQIQNESGEIATSGQGFDIISNINMSFTPPSSDAIVVIVNESPLESEMYEYSYPQTAIDAIAETDLLTLVEAGFDYNVSFDLAEEITEDLPMEVIWVLEINLNAVDSE